MTNAMEAILARIAKLEANAVSAPIELDYYQPTPLEMPTEPISHMKQE